MRLTRRSLILGGLGLAGTGTAAVAAGSAALDLMVTRYRVAPAQWPRERRLTVAALADLHAGGPNMGRARVRAVVDAANALAPDLIVLLGDYFATHAFITERVPHAAWAAELARLTAPLGVWAILGNQDWWNGAERARKALADVRIPLLENDAVRLEHGGGRFWLAGLADQLAIRLGPGRYRGADDLPGTLARITGDEPAILLAHEPDIFPDVPDRFALTLAGHTHGGQIRVPLVWPALMRSKHGARYAYGHVVESGRHLVVSGGLGTAIVPARLGVPPEIVWIELA